MDRVDIADRDGYLLRLNRAIFDKLFFVDKTDATVIVDYGCGDGTLLRTMAAVWPYQEFKYIGFDDDPRMLEIARRKPTPPLSAVMYFSEWSNLQQYVETIRADGSRVAIVLSSVVHEIYHYRPANEVAEIFHSIWNGPFDYVCMRDMMASETAYRAAKPEHCARVRQMFDPDKLRQWQRHWGRLEMNESLLHFLLTYTYTENWEREVRENYFPMPLERFMKLAPRWFDPIYLHHSIPPFLLKQVRRDFGFDVPDPTHIKIIWERTQ